MERHAAESEPGAIEFRVLGPIEAVRDGHACPWAGRVSAFCSPCCSSSVVDPCRWTAWSTRSGRPSRQTAPRQRCGRTCPSSERRLARWPQSRSVQRAMRSSFRRTGLTPSGSSVSRSKAAMRSTVGRRAVPPNACAQRSASGAANRSPVWRTKPRCALRRIGSRRSGCSALEERIEADLAFGRAAQLVDELEALVVVHPYRERLWRQLMLALYRSERQTDALATYHRARSAARRGARHRAGRGAAGARTVDPASRSRRPPRPLRSGTTFRRRSRASSAARPSSPTSIGCSMRCASWC